MNEMDELVEEIRLLWCEECADGPLRSEYCEYDGEWNKACATGAEDLCRERARKVVVRTFQAVRDGDVKLPGEDTRIKDFYVGELGGFRDIIALSPAGAGKEEKG